MPGTGAIADEIALPQNPPIAIGEFALEDQEILEPLMLVGNGSRARLKAHEITPLAPSAVIADRTPGDFCLQRPLKVIGQKADRLQGNDLATRQLIRHFSSSCTTAVVGNHYDSRGHL